MPKFVIEREIPGASQLTDAQIRETSLKSLEVLKELGPGIQWIQSYVTEDKIYCIFFAEDVTWILERAEAASARIAFQQYAGFSTPLTFNRDCLLLARAIPRGNPACVRSPREETFASLSSTRS